MSMFPAGRSLQQYFPDLDEFLLDPAGYLTAAPVQIGPRRAYGLAGFFAALGGAFLLAAAVSGVWTDERFLLGLGCCFGAILWLSWSLRMRGHALVLRPDGLEVRYRDATVWCPWALFNVDAAPILPEGDDPQVAVILPVATNALPLIELRRNDSLAAVGAQVSLPFFRIAPPDQVILSARYEIAAGDLGVLLLKLGGRLGRKLPAGIPLPEAQLTGEPALAEVSGPDSAGWYTISLGRLRFPPRCCDCEQPTSALMRLPLATGDLTGHLTGTAAESELSVPLCADCQAQMREYYKRAGIRGLNLGVVAGFFFALGVAWVREVRDMIALAFVGLLGAVAGALLGFLAGSARAQALPVQLRWYRPSAGLLQVRFANPHYADLVLAASTRKNAER